MPGEMLGCDHPGPSLRATSLDRNREIGGGFRFGLRIRAEHKTTCPLKDARPSDLPCQPVQGQSEYWRLDARSVRHSQFTIRDHSSRLYERIRREDQAREIWSETVHRSYRVLVMRYGRHAPLVPAVTSAFLLNVIPLMTHVFPWHRQYRPPATSGLKSSACTPLRVATQPDSGTLQE
jgi:hypothetical protein